MTRVEEVQEQIENRTYDDTDPAKLEAVVDGVLADMAEPMTFEVWLRSNEVYERIRRIGLAVSSEQAERVGRLVESTWRAATRRHMWVARKREEERLNA